MSHYSQKEESKISSNQISTAGSKSYLGGYGASSVIRSSNTYKPKQFGDNYNKERIFTKTKEDEHASEQFIRQSQIKGSGNPMNSDFSQTMGKTTAQMLQ
jgi:hypothetical protein